MKLTRMVATILVAILPAISGRGVAQATGSTAGALVQTLPFGINVQGDVVGFYLIGTSNLHAFLLHKGIFTTIDDPKGAKGTQAFRISPQGDILGTYEDSAGTSHGFLWHRGIFTTIDDPKGSKGTSAYGINSQGDIVGSYRAGNGLYRGFLLHRDIFTTIEWQ